MQRILIILQPTGFAEQVDSVPGDGMIVTFATRQQAETVSPSS